jgi:hypothetical protein
MPKHTWDCPYKVMRVHNCVLHILRSFSANQALHAPANSKINKDQATTEPQHVHIHHELRTAASHADSRANLIADLAEPRRFSVKQSFYMRGCLQPNDSISRTELLNLILRNQQADSVDDTALPLLKICKCSQPL